MAGSSPRSPAESSGTYRLSQKVGTSLMTYVPATAARSCVLTTQSSAMAGTRGRPLARRRGRAHTPSVVPMAPPRLAKIPLVRKRSRRGKGARRFLRRWHARARWARRNFVAAPPAVRIALVSLAALVLFSAANLVYHVARKPTELLYPVSTALGKMPAETWRHYGPLFREYSTSAITPQLLAALAQVARAGNPMSRTYLPR